MSAISIESRAGKMAWYNSCNMLLAKYGDFPSTKGRFRVEACRSYIRLRIDPESNRRVIDSSFQCGNRLCPWCAGLKSRKDRCQLSACLMLLEDKPDFDWFKVEFTWKNCPWDDLKESFYQGGRNFNTLVHTLQPCGSYRSAEFTIGTKEYADHTFHPHFHTLLLFPAGSTSEEALRARIQKLWDGYYGYATQIHVSRFDPHSHKLGDFAKYVLKLPDLFDTSKTSEEDLPELLSKASKGIRGVRAIGYGGVLNEVRKTIKDLPYSDDLDIDSAYEDLRAPNENFIQDGEGFVTVDPAVIEYLYEDLGDVWGYGCDVLVCDNEVSFPVHDLYCAEYPSPIRCCLHDGTGFTYPLMDVGIYQSLHRKVQSRRNFKTHDLEFFQDYEIDHQWFQFQCDSPNEPYMSLTWAKWCEDYIDRAISRNSKYLFLTPYSFELMMDSVGEHYRWILSHYTFDPIQRVFVQVDRIYPEGSYAT